LVAVSTAWTELFLGGDGGLAVLDLAEPGLALVLQLVRLADVRAHQEQVGPGVQGQADGQGDRRLVPVAAHVEVQLGRLQWPPPGCRGPQRGPVPSGRRRGGTGILEEGGDVGLGAIPHTGRVVEEAELELQLAALVHVALLRLHRSK
jgi:hypothetical protein